MIEIWCEYLEFRTPDGARYKFPPARCPESSAAVGVKVYALNPDKGDAAHALAGWQIICKNRDPVSQHLETRRAG